MIRRIDAKLGAVIAIAVMLALSALAHTAKPPRDPNRGWTITQYPFSENANGDWQIVRLTETPVD